VGWVPRVRRGVTLVFPRRLAALALVFAATACGGGSTGGGASLTGRTFLSTAVTDGGQPRPLVKGTRIRMSFKDGELRVNAGCNHLRGRLRVDGETLVVDETGGTLIGCPPGLSEQDRWVTGVMSGRPRWRLDGDTLTLTAGAVILTLLDERVADPDRPLSGPQWTVDTVISGGAAGSVPPGSALTFVDGRTVTGTTPCGPVAAAVTRQGDTLRFSGLTRTACADPVHAAIVAVLSGDATVLIKGDTLTLTTADGRGIRLRAQP
jgi:heat shock protein HslJ